MVARTLVTTICNQCLPKEKEGERTTIGGHDFDVCAKHRKEAEQQAETWAKYVAEFSEPGNGRSARANGHGRRATGPAASATTHAECGVPGCGSVVSIKGKYQHAKTVHNMKTGEIEWRRHRGAA